ncbi:MAG: outer membrane beta-barrel protein [Nitrospira sp.]|nr:outer membrane beta-barrel protein [Nitrospira sp.]
MSLNIGHFYTILGYEVPATNNFFYSKSYSYQFAGPFTHWGGLATWNATDRITVQGGVVNGWDAVDRTKDRPTGLAKVKYTAPTISGRQRLRSRPAMNRPPILIRLPLERGTAP